MNAITRILAVATTVYLAFAIVFFGLRRAGYSHVRYTISELGEFGAADSALVSYGVFLPVGLSVAALAVVFWRRREAIRGALPIAVLAFCIAIGYIVAAFFPCDPGAPLSGSARTAVHNTGGAIEYFGGAFALFVVAYLRVRWHWGFLIAAIITLCVGFGISAPELVDVRGLLQRFGEAALFGSLILAAELTRHKLPTRE